MNLLQNKSMCSAVTVMNIHVTLSGSRDPLMVLHGSSWMDIV